MPRPIVGGMSRYLKLSLAILVILAVFNHDDFVHNLLLYMAIAQLGALGLLTTPLFLAVVPDNEVWMGGQWVTLTKDERRRLKAQNAARRVAAEVCDN